MLQEVIKRNKEYFKGIEVSNGMILVRVLFKDKWGTYPSKDESIQVVKSKDVENEWFYYGNYDSVSIDSIFELIEETVQMNLDAEEKLELLNNKFEELKNLFATESLAKLKSLEFVMKEPVVVRKKRKYTRRKKTVENNDSPLTSPSEQTDNQANSINSKDCENIIVKLDNNNVG